MLIIGVGQIAAGAMLVVSGLTLITADYVILGVVNTVLGVYTLWNSIHKIEMKG